MPTEEFVLTFRGIIIICEFELCCSFSNKRDPYKAQKNSEGPQGQLYFGKVSLNFCPSYSFVAVTKPLWATDLDMTRHWPILSFYLNTFYLQILFRTLSSKFVKAQDHFLTSILIFYLLFLLLASPFSKQSQSFWSQTGLN